MNYKNICIPDQGNFKSSFRIKGTSSTPILLHHDSYPSPKIEVVTGSSRYSYIPWKFPVNTPDRERWLWQNREAISSVQRGLHQARQGRGKYLGSFAEYVDLEIDD
jgi:hypothetical protein